MFYLLNRLSSVFFTEKRNPEFNKFLSRLIPSEFQGQNVKVNAREIVDDWRLIENDTKKIHGVHSPVEILMSGVFDDLMVDSKSGKPIKTYDSKITKELVKTRSDLFV